MIIVNLKGGLGNQMFEYAAGRRLAVKHNTELKLDTTFLLDRNPALNVVFRDLDLDIFPNLKLTVATEKESANLKYYFNTPFKSLILRRLNSKLSFYKEKKFSYHKNFESLPSNVYLNGYWQSEKYFKPIESIIRHDFTFAPYTIQENYQLSAEITNHNSVCINIRRGDFVHHQNSSDMHGFVGIDYINNGVRFISENIKNPTFYIFSDDIVWCKENIKLPFPTVFVDHLHAGKKFADYLQLMATCKHFIIPNSSFAWWAAWLSPNSSKTVIAPKAWFKNGPKDTHDLLPNGWITL